jgi:hypothetical protein
MATCLVLAGPDGRGSLDDLVLGALSRAFPDRAKAVEAFIHAEPPRLRRPAAKAFTWSHLAKYGVEGGRGAWLQSLWQEPEIQEALKESTSALRGWPAFRDLAA